MDSTELGVGVVGGGWAGQNAATQIAKVDRARLVGVSDIDAARKLADQCDVPAYRELEQLLERPELDAVMIGSPPHAHKEQVLAAVAQGKHIFCEKPLAMTPADCDQMIAAADNAHVKICVGHVVRLYGSNRKIKQLIESEKLGPPSAMAITRSGVPFGTNPDHWRAKQELCGGLLFEINVHELDLLRFFCGEPEEVFAQSQKVLPPPPDYPDLWHVQVRFRNGAIGLLRSSQCHFLREQHLTIQCPGGTLSTNNDDHQLRLKKRDDTLIEVSKDELAQMEDEMLWEYRSWIEAIHDGTPMVVTAFDGRQAVAMASAAIESDRTGKPSKVV